MRGKLFFHEEIPPGELRLWYLISDPLLGLLGDREQRFQIVQAERCPISPDTRLISEWTGERRREKRTVLALVPPDRRLDGAASQRVHRFVVGTHLVSSSVEMKVVLTQEAESQRTVHGGNIKHDQQSANGSQGD